MRESPPIICKLYMCLLLWLARLCRVCFLLLLLPVLVPCVCAWRWARAV